MINTYAKNGRCYQIPDLTNQRFGRLVVIEYADRKGRDHRWLCACDCGTKRPIYFRSLKRGLAKSCGCLRTEAQKLTGSAHPHYKGGKSHDANGYVTLTSLEHGKHYNMREHRVVMEKYLGRKLSKHEIVHHINEDKADNRLENLQLMTRAEHGKHHHG